MGLKFNKIIGSTNINDTIPRYLSSGVFKPNKTKRTISNAMDVSNPSNFSRIEKLFKNDFKLLTKKMISEKVTEIETKNEIKKIFKKFGYVLDPHGAVGLVGLKRNLYKNEVGVFFETAHPIKFLNSIKKIIKLKEDFFNISGYKIIFFSKTSISKGIVNFSITLTHLYVKTPSSILYSKLGILMSLKYWLKNVDKSNPIFKEI